MKLSAIALALGLGLAAVSSNAAVLVGDPTEGLDTGTVKVKSGSFSDFWSFSLPGASSLDVNAFQIKFGNTYNLTGTLSLFSGTQGHGTAVGSSYSLTSATDGISFSNLAAGNYYFLINGIADGRLGGKYQLQAISAAVPEPETYALMGLGLIGLVVLARRKQSGTPAMAFA